MCWEPVVCSNISPSQSSYLPSHPLFARKREREREREGEREEEMVEEEAVKM